MKKNFIFYIALAFLFIVNIALGGNGTKKLIKKGDKQFRKANLDKALSYYQKALAIDSENCYANFQIGSIYYLADSERVKSLPYFERTIKYASGKKDDTIIDAYYYMGNCYTLLKKYDLATTAFSKYITHVDNSKVNQDILKEVQHDIDICHGAPVILRRSSDSAGYMIDGKLHPIYIKNAGSLINSPYPEYAQVLLDHDSTIIFTSRRPASQNGKQDIFSNEYFEDIFISHKDSLGRWGAPTLFSKDLHFKTGKRNHLASVSISSDGTTLYIYNKAHMWQSARQHGAGWIKPARIGKNIKHIRNFMPSVFTSYDGKKLLLVSDKPGGWGGKDIYISEKQNDGSWSEPENLGPTINTAYDEDAPFLMPDNKTLYFASNGLPGLGGYDIFRSIYENGKWSTPKNLGAPINSSADDIYFIYDTLMKKGYFSSSRPHDGFGGMDLYGFSFVCDNITNTVLQGKIVANGNNPPASTIIVSNIITGKQYSAQSDQSGNYSVLLKPDTKYNIAIKAPGYMPFYTTATLPHQCDAYNLYQIITVAYVIDSLSKHTGQQLMVRNGFYRPPAKGNYKNARNDESFSQFINSFKDTASVWESDTMFTMNYTPAQLDSIYPKAVAQENVVKSSALPKKPIVYFAFNKYTIDGKYASILDSIAAVAKGNSKYKIQIEGNTDTVGSTGYNLQLSIARAKAVAHYLVNKGIKSKQILTIGNGKRHLATIATEGASGLNRRDEIVIIE